MNEGINPINMDLQNDPSSVGLDLLMQPWAEELYDTLLNLINISSIISILVSGYWIYLINKKLWEKNAWLSFIPLLQYYSIVKASGKSLWWLLWIILIWFAWVIAAIIIYIIFIIFINIVIWTNILMQNSNIIILSVILFFFLIVIWVNSWYIYILHCISKRIWKWKLVTLWLFLLPFIMFPIVWIKMDDKSSENKDSTDKEEESNTQEL